MAYFLTVATDKNSRLRPGRHCSLVSNRMVATQPARQAMQSNAVRVFFAATALAMNAATAQAGSAEQGQTLARAQCAECHLLGREKGLSSDEKAPPFANIANTPGMTAAALRVALSTPHRLMPNLIIKGDDAESIIAYILSLKDNK